MCFTETENITWRSQNDSDSMSGTTAEKTGNGVLTIIFRFAKSDFRVLTLLDVNPQIHVHMKDAASQRKSGEGRSAVYLLSPQIRNTKH